MRFYSVLKSREGKKLKMVPSGIDKEKLFLQIERIFIFLSLVATGNLP